MVDQQTLASRLADLEGYLKRLQGFSEYDRDIFIAEGDLHHLAERFLHLATESILDITQHVISDLGFRQPNSYKEAVQILKEEHILEDDLAERIKGWMGFRNVLVHLYLKIDHGRSYDVIQNELEDLQTFAARMARFLDD